MQVDDCGGQKRASSSLQLQRGRCDSSSVGPGKQTLVPARAASAVSPSFVLDCNVITCKRGQLGVAAQEAEAENHSKLKSTRGYTEFQNNQSFLMRPCLIKTKVSATNTIVIRL